MSKITVIGSMVMDNVAKMDKFPEAGETVLGATLEFFPGGKGANQCVSVARLGGDVEMVGMLGKDGTQIYFVKSSKKKVSNRIMYFRAISRRLWRKFKSTQKDKIAFV